MIPFSFLKETRSTLIDVYSAYFLQAKLPAQSRVEWSCVYSSLVDGSSWNMLKKVIEKTGSLIILVSESMNLENVFGVYIDKELEKSSKWGGNNDNFLFILSKQEKTGLNKFASFRGSGINSNFQYYNYGTETLPNGVGFGGQLEYFGFWISASLNEGHSYPSATYSNSEPISPLNNFVPGIVEVFLVKKTTNHLFIDEFETDSDACNSAIKNNPEATAILELANKKLYSKDFAENQ
ncbi:TLD domain-containing protein 1 [Zancudomyces culisetae]|uniref:Oxidation resistance protein 1 n=1 Tax=Zancudomyces culisetae TaxID=1213189 RepID=A0A1R1PMM6_ZANCU|nr:TLD domain-containing protein 1 [Zancudomyces culisetae]|eukprot:OMH82199.1 TLD domain-containing protein 1 [Zancudomyces culisetae]